MEAAKEVSDSILESSAIIPTGTQPNLTLGEDSYAKDGSPTESTKIGEAVDLMEKQKKDLESIKATSNSNSKDVTELESESVPEHVLNQNTHHYGSDRHWADSTGELPPLLVCILLPPFQLGIYETP